MRSWSPTTETLERPLFVFITNITFDLISRGMDPYIIVIVILGPFLTIYFRIPFIHFLSGVLIIIITTSPCLNFPTGLLLLDCYHLIA